jgi:hypothetical protein
MGKIVQSWKQIWGDRGAGNNYDFGAYSGYFFSCNLLIMTLKNKTPLLEDKGACVF